MEVFLRLNNIDVCLVTETHSTKQTYIKIRGYKTYQTIHPDNKAKGGSAIIIKESIKHYEECHLQSVEMQLTMVGIESVKQKLNLGAVYCPPRYNLKKENYKNLIRHLGNRFILGGDYNAKHVEWGSRLTTTKGRELRKAIREEGCQFYSTSKPTYWPTDVEKVPDLLDFFITRRVSSNFVYVEENFELNSDHSAVILTFSERIIKKTKRLTLTNATTNWKSLREEVANKINLNVELKTKDDLEVAVENFIKVIQNAAWNNTKLSIQQKIGCNYPNEIRELVKDKRRARRMWQQTRDPHCKNILNKKTQQLRRAIQKLKEESYRSYLENLTAGEDTNFSLWKATRKTKRPNKQIPTIRKQDGTWAKSNGEKADAFANHLAEIFKPNDSQSDGLDVEEIIGRENQESQEIELATIKEVMNEIKSSLKLKKAPGYDLITAEILKQLPPKGIRMLTYLINAAFRMKHVPDAWKVAEVIMITKPGKPSNKVESYRPVSLLPVISKLFEKLLLKRLKSIIEDKCVIPNHQFGFRQGHATVDQIHRITDVIEKALEGNQVC